MPKKKIDELVEEAVETKADPIEAFIDRQLAAINSMQNKAKAKRSAERVLANRKGK